MNEETEIVARVYRKVFSREPGEHGDTWAKMVRLGVFNEKALEQVFQLTSEYKPEKE